MSRLSAKNEPWLTLGQASEVLGVHPTTLRSWVDSGLVHAFLTPGGHRRFQMSELRAFLESRQASGPTSAIAVAEQTLNQVRTQLENDSLRQQPWYVQLTDEQRSHHRATGQRVLSLLMQFINQRDNADQFLSQARAIAQEYGREFAVARLSMNELAQAFLLFRRMILNSTYDPSNRHVANDSDGIRLLQRTDLFMDEFLIAMLDSYEDASRQQRSASNGPASQLRRTKSLK